MEEVKLTEMPGAFVGSLIRNNKQIKEDRATAIAEDVEILFKREVEDLELQIKKTRRDRESLLDLSPTNATSLILASDFNSKNFIAKYLELGLTIRNLGIRLEIATEGYNYLFKAKAE